MQKILSVYLYIFIFQHIQLESHSQYLLKTYYKVCDLSLIWKI